MPQPPQAPAWGQQSAAGYTQPLPDQSGYGQNQPLPQQPQPQPQQPPQPQAYPYDVQSGGYQQPGFAQPGYEQYPGYPQQPAKKNNNALIASVVAAVLVVGGGITAAVMLTGKSSNNTPLAGGSHSAAAVTPTAATSSTADTQAGSDASSEASSGASSAASSSLTTPTSVGGLKLLTNSTAQEAVRTLRKDLGSEADLFPAPVVAVYNDNGGDDVTEMLEAQAFADMSSSSRDELSGDPSTIVAQLASGAGIDDAKQEDTTATDGALSCGSRTVDSSTVTFCFWYDDTSFGWLDFLGSTSLSDDAATADKVRAALEGQN